MNLNLMEGEPNNFFFTEYKHIFMHIKDLDTNIITVTKMTELLGQAEKNPGLNFVQQFFFSQ